MEEEIQLGGGGNSFLQRLFDRPVRPTSHRSHRSHRPHVDPLVLQTQTLAADAVSFTVSSSRRARTSKASDNIQTCLRRCVLRMLDRHSITFGGMINKLEIDENIDFHDGFRDVADELFKDDITWAKIVALFAFGARVAQHCSNNHMDDLVKDVADCLAEFAVEKLTPFIREQGGWVRLCEIFPEEKDYEKKLWQGLLMVGAGLGAVAAMLVLRQGLG